MKHYGKIKNLKIDFLDEERFVEDLLKFEGKDVVFILSILLKSISYYICYFWGD